MSEPADRAQQAHAAIREVVADRAARGNRIPPPAVQATAAALLVDLWAAAERHGVPPDSWGWHHHLPQAALNTVHAAHRYRPTRHRGGRR